MLLGVYAYYSFTRKVVSSSTSNTKATSNYTVEEKGKQVPQSILVYTINKETEAKNLEQSGLREAIEILKKAQLDDNDDPALRNKIEARTKMFTSKNHILNYQKLRYLKNHSRVYYLGNDRMQLYILRVNKTPAFRNVTDVTHSYNMKKSSG